MKYKNILQKVYIGLPVYNGAKTIEKAINSVVAQTFQNFKLVISDNASNDETAIICKKFLLKVFFIWIPKRLHIIIILY